jgi:hypothetical protein
MLYIKAFIAYIKSFMIVDHNKHPPHNKFPFKYVSIISEGPEKTIRGG